MGSIDFEIRGDNRPFMKALDGLSKGVDETANKVKHTGKEIEDIFKDIAALAGISFSLNGIAEFASKVFEIRSYFQDINSSMKVFLGSQEKADKFTNDLLGYAYYNMFEFSDLAKASQQLIAYGNTANEIIPILDKLSNVASGTGANLDELVGLYNKAKSTGFVDSQAMYSWATRGIVIKDVLKEMGEAATGSSISFEQLNKVLNHVTGEGGLFNGLMASQMGNLSASMGQFEDDLTSSMNEIGEMLQGPMKQMIDWADMAVGNYKEIGKVIMECVAVLGTYKAALVASMAISKSYATVVGMMAVQENLAAAAGVKLSSIQTLLNISTMRLTASMKALASATVLNPYVMAAATFTALAYAVYKVMDYTNEYAAEEERLNDRTEEQNKIVKENTEEITKNVSKLGDELKTLAEKKAIYDELHSKYPSLFADYKNEKDLIDKIAQARRMDNFEIERKLKLQNRDTNFSSDKTRLEELREMHNLLTNPRNKSDEKRYKELFSKYAADIQKVKRFGDSLADATSRLMDTTASTINSTMNDMRSDAADAFDEILKTMNQDQLSEAVSRYQKAIKKAQSQGKEWIQLSGDAFSTSVKEMQRRINLAKRRANELDRESNRDYVKEAKKNYEDAQKKVKEIYKNRNDKSLYPTDQAYMDAMKKAKEEEKNAKSAYEAAIPSGLEKSLGEMAKSQAKFKEALKSLNIARSRAVVDMELDTRKNEINAMKEGSAKTLKQIQLDFDSQMVAIRRGYEDLQTEKINQAKRLWEADVKNKGKVFDEKSVDVNYTEAEMDNLIVKIDAAIAAREESISSLHRQETSELYEYLEEYGSVQQKKLAITNDYNNRIISATSAAQKAMLSMERDEKLKEIEAEDVFKDIDWDGVFSDLKGHTEEYLKGLRNQLQELLNSGNLPIEDLQTVSEKIHAIDEELVQQAGVWDFVGSKAQEHRRLLAEAADAQERLNKAKDEEIKATESLEALQVKMSGILSAQGKNVEAEDISSDIIDGLNLDKTSEAYKMMQPIIEKLLIAEGKLAKARENVTKATNDAKNKEDKAKRDSATAVADWFSDAQQFITDKGIDQLPDLLQKVGLGEAGDRIGAGLSGFTNAADAAADFMSGNYIGALTKGISAIKDFGHALGIGGGNAASVANTTERLTAANKTLQYSIDALKEEMERSRGSQTTNVYKELMKDQEEYIQNSGKILAAQMGYHDAHHSNDYYINKALSQADWNIITQKVGKKVSEASQLWSLTPDQLRQVTSLTLIWDKIYNAGQYDKSEYIDSYLSLAGTLDDITDNFKEAMTRVTFDNVYDSFISTLMNMDKKAEDFSEDFSEYMMQAMLSNKVGELMEENLENWYDSWSDKMKDGTLTDAELTSLSKGWDDMVSKGIELRDNLAAVTGYGKNSAYSQHASVGSKIAASQDSVDELNGRYTAVQIASEGTRTAVENALLYIEQMATFCISSGVAVSEIRNLLILGNSYLEDIAKYSKSIYNEFGTKIDKMIKTLE